MDAIIHLSKFEEEPIIVFCTCLPTLAANPVKYQATHFYPATASTEVLVKTAVARIKRASGLEETVISCLTMALRKLELGKDLRMNFDETESKNSGGDNFRTEGGKACYKPQS